MGISRCTKDLKVVQWNARGIRSKIDILLQHSEVGDIFLISETKVKETEDLIVKGFDTVKWGRVDGGGGGVAVLISKDIKYEKYRNNLYKCDGKLEACAINVFTENHRKITVISCYRPPDAQHRITTEQWERFFRQFEHPFVAGGDLNVHHQKWGSGKNCAEGNALKQALERPELTLLNDGSSTFISSSYGSPSNIDLTICSSDLGLSLDWKVHDDNWGSDHMPIITTYNAKADLNGAVDRSTRKKHNKKTDWTAFANNLDDLISRDEDFFRGRGRDRDLQSVYATFISCVEEAVIQATPAGWRTRAGASVARRNPPSPFWNDKCKELDKKRRDALKTYRNDRTRENFKLYKVSEFRAKKGIREIKKERYKEFCDSITRFVSPTYVWNITKRFKSRWNKVENANEFKQEKIDGVKRLIKDICPPWCAPPKPELSNACGDPFFDEPFSELEFEHALSMVNLSSAPGLDGIDYQVLMCMSKSAKEVLLGILNDLYQGKIYPAEWKQILVHFIPKQSTDKMRPISLSSCTCKVLERMISNRLTWWLEHHKKLPDTQNGFRCSRSCTDNLAILHTDIVKAFNEDKVVAAVFIDVIGAYNEVLPDILIGILKDLGVSECLLSFIHATVASRQLFFSFGNFHDCLWTYRGVPQGGVLSPLLYTLYQGTIDNNSVSLLQFADDIVFYVISLIVHEAVWLANRKIVVFNEQFRKLGLEMSPEKTQLVVFSNKPAMQKETFQLKIGEKVIESSDCVRFLGMFLHKSLNWDMHINQLVKRCQNPIKIINCLRSTWWGADTLVLINLFKSLIQSRIDYGCFILNDLKKSQSEKIEQIIFKALRSAMGYRMSTPKNVILAESKVVPFHVRSRYLGCRYLMRAMSLSNHKLLPLLEDLVEMEGNPTFIMKVRSPLMSCFRETNPVAHLVPVSDKPVNFTFEYEAFLYQPQVSFKEGLSIKNAGIQADALFEDEFCNILKDDICVYTDGSKTKGNFFGGFACFFSTGEEIKFRSRSLASIFTLEAMAILEALNEIAKREERSFSIFSDSMSVLRAITTLGRANKTANIVMQIKQELLNIRKNGKKVQMFWIPAHEGIKGNEVADQLAKEAPRNGRDTRILIPSSDLGAEWKKRQWDDFDKLIRRSGQVKGIYYFENFYRDTREQWFKDYSFLSRKSVVSINRIRCGHNSLNESLARFKIVPSAECSCGEGIQSTQHVILQCKEYSKERQNLIRALIKNFKTFPISVEMIINVKNCETLKAFGKFIDGISQRI